VTGLQWTVAIEFAVPRHTILNDATQLRSRDPMVILMASSLRERSEMSRTSLFGTLANAWRRGTVQGGSAWAQSGVPSAGLPPISRIIGGNGGRPSSKVDVPGDAPIGIPEVCPRR